ncbi:DUF726-domain-containing protein [Yamadazyma tenuis ATCC 10573]|uniref:DUF726-domain-containing protein n=2 Tax=Candida tenuis TaxID=2315449 RepID=G3BCE8_CANTC|nr:DUF726-domain-containing protein [Yamadazyma tenuis ATCC 10573]EGV60818.1 DUF726-domain-containing protein [Yamadazyma tenuis ATCC 10573]
MATWKTMKTVTEQDYYDEKGNLEFSSGRDHDRFDPKNVNGGYTRIDTAEQVAKYAEMDKKTDFLFVTKDTDKQEVAKYRHEDNNEDSDDDILYDEVETMETADALQSTREMLNEGQKFSYVGIVKLIMVDMAAELAGIKQSTTSKVARQLSASQKNFANWSMYISGKVYSHLNVNEDEQKMIENLSIHGVNVSDLTSSLVKEDDRKPGPLSLDWVLVCDLFLLLLSDGYYDSRSRALLMRFANELAIEKIEVFQFERRLLNSLELETKDKSLEDKEDKLNDKQIIQKYIKRNKGRRMAYIGLATVGGTLAIGLSAGLLAPVIGAGLAAGLTTVGIGGTSGFLAGVGGTTIITTGGVMLGAKVGSKAGMRRAGDVETFELKPLHNNKRSNLIITVSGWMTGKSDDVRLPFSTVDPVMGDLFSVLWEPEMLKSMGQTISILASEALTSSIQQILGATILTSLMAAIQIPVALSKLSYLVDNPWNVSLDRAWKAGKILADTLVSGNLGVRPMTLVGFSLGSRVIYSCLVELAQKGCFGLVENVIILGTPITINKDQLGLARSVVSGKFINGYSRKDWVLGYLFRATGGGLASVAGIAPINDSYGIENIDVTEFVEGHMAYRKAIPKILQELQWEVLDEEFAEIEEPDNEEGERQRQLIHEFDEARAKMKKEIEDEQKEQTEKKGWKKFFSRRQNNWWSDIGESSDTTGEEYIEQENPTPIFDVGSLLKEAKEIEHLSIPDKSQLPQEVPITKPVSESKLESKPEQKPVLTSISETVAQKSTQLKHKASDMLSKPSESSLDKA